MRHAWVRFGEDRVNPFRVLRWCRRCGRIQERIAEQNWGRVTGYLWRPKVGRCPGTGATSAGPPKRRRFGPVG